MFILGLFTAVRLVDSNLEVDSTIDRRGTGGRPAQQRVCLRKATIRRTIEMSNRVLSLSRAHPDPSPGYSASLARLEKSLAEADALAARQRDGINAVRSATTQKRALRRKTRRTQLVHLARVAEAAATELPDIAQKFRLTQEAVPYLASEPPRGGCRPRRESEGDSD